MFFIKILKSNSTTEKISVILITTLFDFTTLIGDFFYIGTQLIFHFQRTPKSRNLRSFLDTLRARAFMLALGRANTSKLYIHRTVEHIFYWGGATGCHNREHSPVKLEKQHPGKARLHGANFE